MIPRYEDIIGEIVSDVFRRSCRLFQEIEAMRQIHPHWRTAKPYIRVLLTQPEFVWAKPDSAEVMKTARRFFWSPETIRVEER